MCYASKQAAVQEARFCYKSSFSLKNGAYRCRRPAISTGLSLAMPSWVKFPSIKGFPGVPGPHFGKSPGPHSTATSLNAITDVTHISMNDHIYCAVLCYDFSGPLSGFHGVPGPQIGKFPVPQRTATSVKVMKKVTCTSWAVRLRNITLGQP